MPRTGEPSDALTVRRVKRVQHFLDEIGGVLPGFPFVAGDQTNGN